jgi:hypothetical protein
MQLILKHIAVVRPALRRYDAAEKALTDALQSKDAGTTDAARQEVMLAARQAVVALDHLSDFVFKQPSPSTPKFTKLEDVRRAVDTKCVFLRTAKPRHPPPRGSRPVGYTELAPDRLYPRGEGRGH